ncbi:MAG: hypothetical protein ABI622_10615 [Chloroflexota bacterium]
MLTTTDLRRTLLERLVDDAGLFPPARLPMADALTGHAANRVGPLAWLQGRFIVPASRLGEMGAAWPEGLAALRLSVIGDSAGVADVGSFPDALEADLAAAAAAERADGRLRVELVEVRVPDPAAVALIGPAIRRAAFAGPVASYVEAADSTDADALRAHVAAVATERANGATRAGAKVRTGGLEPAMFPDPAAVAAFLAACVAEGVPFKATAGLHHPVRGDDPASGLRMHGFINLLAAVALLHAGELDAASATTVVAEEDAGAFVVTADAFGWRGRTVEGPAVASVRAEAFTSYGSCSFDEPTADLAALGWLP